MEADWSPREHSSLHLLYDNYSSHITTSRYQFATCLDKITYTISSSIKTCPKGAWEQTVLGSRMYSVFYTHASFCITVTGEGEEKTLCCRPCLRLRQLEFPFLIGGRLGFFRNFFWIKNTIYYWFLFSIAPKKSFNGCGYSLSNRVQWKRNLGLAILCLGWTV